MSSNPIQNDPVAQESIKKAPSARYLEGKRVDILSTLNVDLQRRVLLFLLQEPVPIENSRTLQAKQRLYGEFCTHHHTIAVVSKQWKTILGDFANVNAATRGDLKILTPRELAQLKTKVFALDLNSPLICDRFMELARAGWNADAYTMGVYMSKGTTLVDYLGFDVFVEMVEGEYKRFLVLKCVEMIASGRNLSEDALQWLEPSRPGLLVGLYWKAHREMADLYLEHCDHLIQGFIDPIDSAQRNEECSSTSDKHKVLFQFEQQSFLKHNLTCSCRTAANDSSLQGKERIMTRLQIFRYYFIYVTDNECSGYGDSQYYYCVSCSVAGRTNTDYVSMRNPHECDGVCHKPCCPSCCTITNGFDPITQSMQRPRRRR